MIDYMEFICYIHFQNKLGILEKDEMILGEVIDTMSTFQGYCPVTDDGIMHKLPLGGDGLSVMRGYSAQRARGDSFCPVDRLEGLLPKPEDWHESVILLQVRHFKDFKNQHVFYGSFKARHFCLPSVSVQINKHPMFLSVAHLHG